MDIVTFHRLFDVTKNSGRISGHDRVGRNIFGDNTASAYNRVLADMDVRKNRRTRTDRRTLLYDRTFDLPIGFGLQIPIGGRSARIAVIDKHHSVPDEDVVLNQNSFTDKRVTGNLAASSDTGIFLDFYECADLCLVSDLAPIHVYKFRQSDILTHLDVVRDAVIGVHRYTKEPVLLSDSLAASSILTTRSPAHPLLNGSCPLETQSTK